MARNPDLEAAIIQSPEDDNLYRAYADWLEAHGDLRAQLIRAQLVQRFGGAARQLLWDHADELLGPLAKFEPALMFKRGFVDSANLTERTRLEAGPALAALLAHPVGAFLRRLEIYTHDPAAVIEPLTKAPPTLRYLTFFSPTKPVSLRGLAPVFARLHKLILDGQFELEGPLDLPLANELAIELDALSPESATILAKANLPLIQGLTLGLARTTDAPTKLAPLFARDLPNLTDLVITESDDLDDLCELLVTAPFAPQLTGLTLDGTLTQRGIDALRDSDRLLALKDISVKANIDPGLLTSLDRLGRNVKWCDPSSE